MLTEYLQGIYVSDINTAFDKTIYQKYNIDIVINCTLDFGFLDINIKKIRIPLSNDLNYHTCREEWTDELPFTLNKVTCIEKFDASGIVFKPNGWFTKYHIAYQVANIPKPIIGVSGDVFLEAGFYSVDKIHIYPILNQRRLDACKLELECIFLHRFCFKRLVLFGFKLVEFFLRNFALVELLYHFLMFLFF